MKNVSIGLNVVLLVAVIILYVLYFAGRGSSASEDVGITRDSAKIVYINMDSLLTNYIQSKELNEAYLKKMESNRTELNVKIRQLAKDGEEFQRKVDNNGFLTRERANQEYTDLMIREENLKKLEMEMRDNAIREEMELNLKLYNVITDFLKEYNKTKGYDMILSTTLGGNVFYSKAGFDITADIVRGLNAEYKKN